MYNVLNFARCGSVVISFPLTLTLAFSTPPPPPSTATMRYVVTLCFIRFVNLMNFSILNVSDCSSFLLCVSIDWILFQNVRLECGVPHWYYGEMWVSCVRCLCGLLWMCVFRHLCLPECTCPCTPSLSSLGCIWLCGVCVCFLYSEMWVLWMLYACSAYFLMCASLVLGWVFQWVHAFHHLFINFAWILSPIPFLSSLEYNVCFLWYVYVWQLCWCTCMLLRRACAVGSPIPIFQLCSTDYVPIPRTHQCCCGVFSFQWGVGVSFYTISFLSVTHLFH